MEFSTLTDEQLSDHLNEVLAEQETEPPEERQHHDELQ